MKKNESQQQREIDLSCMDLSEDFTILHFLISDLKNKLKSTMLLSNQPKFALYSSTKTIVDELITSLVSHITFIKKNLKIAIRATVTATTDNQLEYLTLLRNEYRDTIRSIYGLVGSLMISYDWQSPTFNHSLRPLSGLQAGEIIGNINDYKRDQHLDAQKFEKKFIKEYVTSPIKPFIKAYTTSSGMAAGTTALGFVLSQLQQKDIIFVGNHVYFEYQAILHEVLKKQIILFDETDIKQLKLQLQKYKPIALFIDTLSNTEDIVCPDIHTIIKESQKHNPSITIVIDNSCTGIACQPFKKLKNPLSKSHIIVFESLNKLYQFGMDRVTGGIIYGIGKKIGRLYDFRDHLGTNIPDASLLSIPTPNRKLLLLRMKRIWRNTIYVSTTLKKHIVINTSILSTVNISNNHIPSPFFTLSFIPKYKNIKMYKKSINKMLYNSKKRQNQLVSGTSFGMDTTRIYLTASRSNTINPFIRISPGTETMHEINKITSILLKSI
jgi:cystathionine beta-lyase/cystathionine gamma-synthase